MDSAVTPAQKAISFFAVQGKSFSVVLPFNRKIR